MWPYPEIRNIGDIVRFNARRFPNKPAILFEDNVLTMAELDRLSNQFANGLIAGGVKRGDRIAYCGKNSDDYMIALFGIAKASAAFVPLNWRLATEELVEIVGDAEPSFIFVEAEFERSWHHVRDVGNFHFGSQIINPGKPENNPLRQWLAGQSEADPMLECPLDENAWILYTSGTTGRPKGVQLTTGGIIMMRLCEHFEPAFTWSENDTFLFIAPNFHLLGVSLTLQAFYNGGTIAVVKMFDPALVLKEITAKKPTIVALAPIMIQMLVNHPNCEITDFSSVREVVYAGSPISLAVIKQALDKMPCRFMQFYGATESGGAMTLLRPEEHDLNNEERLTSCGKPLPLIDVKIVDSKGNEVAPGESGELLVRTPAINNGYWRKPELWPDVYQNGWYRTGDMARQDAEGFLYLVDRVKDMIVTGGENVYCSEVENCLSLHPSIKQVAIIGVPSEKWGEEVKAVVILKDGETLDEHELIGYAKARLASYKCPKSVDFVEAFPVNANGKVLKRKLREPYWQEKGRNIA
ncbi:MAG: long-chain-fatty-acid--CoA ligase [Porticoccaceae bacterium]|nr:long-chain-fatty-acid--CoA ligase [Porticoccaceae bacterium]